MNHQVNKAVTFFAAMLIALTFGLAGCSTVEGLGDDVESAGDAIEEAADEASD